MHGDMNVKLDGENFVYCRRCVLLVYLKRNTSVEFKFGSGVQRDFQPVGWPTRNPYPKLESTWNVMVHGNAREVKWRENWRMEWVASTLHTTSEHGVSSITTADTHTSAASSRLNWRPCRFKWTRPFRQKTKSGVCACDITFQTQSTAALPYIDHLLQSRFPHRPSELGY
jgi:hypothetical protein